MTDQEATRLSQAMRLALSPAIKQHIARELLAYYKALLSSKARAAIPTVRRMF